MSKLPENPEACADCGAPAAVYKSNSFWWVRSTCGRFTLFSSKSRADAIEQWKSTNKKCGLCDWVHEEYSGNERP